MLENSYQRMNPGNLTILQRIEVEIEYRKRLNDQFIKETCHLYTKDYLGMSQFIKDSWHILEPTTQYTHGWVIDAICEHLYAAHHGHINRLLINVPPGMMKSLILNVFFPAWEWGPAQQPSKRYLATSFSMSLARRDNIKMMDLIKSDWYQQRFGHIFQLSKTEKGKIKFSNDKTGFKEAAPSKSVTGARADRILYDDPHSVSKAESEIERESVNDNFKKAATTRIANPNDYLICVIMQRLHERDLSGIILRDQMGFEHLMLPMEFEESRRCSTSIGFTDPRTVEGELLHPNRFSAADIDVMKHDLDDSYAGQAQQRPHRPGGEVFEIAYLQKYKYENCPRFSRKFIIADTAGKAKKTSAYSVFQLWGVEGYGADSKLYLIESWREKVKSIDLPDYGRAFWDKNNDGSIEAFFIEDKSTGTMLIEALQSYDIPAKPLDHKWSSMNKVGRAESKKHHVKHGKVFLPEEAIFYDELIKELAAFPMGAYADQVDCVVYALFVAYDTMQFSYNNWV